MDTMRLNMEKSRNYIVHPQKFALWLFIITVVMIFGSLTSAYVVNKAFLQQPLVYDLPSSLWTNTLLILFSSIPVQLSVLSLKKEEYGRAMILLGMAIVLGALFLFGQWGAWEDMVASGLPFVDDARTGGAGRVDNSVSFFYIFTGLHGLHIIAGLIALISTMLRTRSVRMNPERKELMFSLTATFWHFLGGLWLYLFIFLKYIQA